MIPLKESPLLSVRVRGPLAVFMNPAFKVERVSLPIITPAAARGIIEAVLWKPAVRWHVERIRVLSPIRFVAFRRNDGGERVAPRRASTLTIKSRPHLVESDALPAEPHTVALRDVDYVIEARLALTGRAAPGDKPAKFIDMFRRRLAHGQHFHRPYLGCPEFAAEILPSENAPPPISETRVLGLMLWDVVYDGPSGNQPIFFAAELRNGVMEVPLEPPLLRAPEMHELTA